MILMYDATMHNSTGMLEINEIRLKIAWSREKMAWFKPWKDLIKAQSIMQPLDVYISEAFSLF